MTDQCQRKETSRVGHRLDTLLDELRTHLNWWLPQFEADAPDEHPEIALVYSKDEYKRGERLRTGIDGVAKEAIGRLEETAAA
jgi:hypothetical protein